AHDPAGAAPTCAPRPHDRDSPSEQRSVACRRVAVAAGPCRFPRVALNAGLGYSGSMFRIAGVVLPALTVACLSGPPESADPLDSEAGVLEWSYRASVFGVLVPISSPIQAAN